MVIFGTNNDSRRGCFMVFTTDTSNSRGTILQMPSSDDNAGLEYPPASNPTYPLIVTSVDMSQMERMFYLKCFNNRTYSYAFGSDVGQMRVNYIGFLASGTKAAASGPNGAEPNPLTGGQESIAAPEFFGAYSQARASVSKQYATLSFGGTGDGKIGIRGLVKGMSMSTANVETNLQNFSFTLDIVEVQDGR